MQHLLLLVLRICVAELFKGVSSEVSNVRGEMGWQLAFLQYLAIGAIKGLLGVLSARILKGE
jgi:hypothetical protein